MRLYKFVKVISAMSKSKGHSSLHEARYTAQLIYLICVGLPDVPHGGLCPCDGIQAVITIANIRLMCVASCQPPQPL